MLEGSIRVGLFCRLYRFQPRVFNVKNKAHDLLCKIWREKKTNDKDGIRTRVGNPLVSGV